MIICRVSTADDNGRKIWSGYKYNDVTKLYEDAAGTSLSAAKSPTGTGDCLLYDPDSSDYIRSDCGASHGAACQERGLFTI